MATKFRTFSEYETVDFGDRPPTDKDLNAVPDIGKLCAVYSHVGIWYGVFRRDLVEER